MWSRSVRPRLTAGRSAMLDRRRYARRAPSAEWAGRERFGLISWNCSRPLDPFRLEPVYGWKACLDDDYGHIVRLLILTGQRRSEIGDLAWSEIDLEKRQAELPERRTKNGRPHIVPLSADAMANLESTTQEEGRDLVFGIGAG